MTSAKDIVLRPISRADADAVVKHHHYSGKVVNNSQLHIGVFLGGRLEGAVQFGPSLDKRKIVGLVEGTKWNEFIELNRMAFSDRLPRNSESRALSITMRMIRKYAPHLQWVVSFADATQSGDGTIYRAAGFVLTSIKRNDQIWAAPGQADARVYSRVSLTDNRSHREQASAQRTLSRVTATKGTHITHTASLRPGIGAIGCAASPGGASSMRVYQEAGWRPLPGFQLRYIYFLDPTARERLTVPILPFSEIERVGAGMYRGQPRARPASIASDASGFQPGEGGASPTAGLQAQQMGLTPRLSDR